MPTSSKVRSCRAAGCGKRLRSDNQRGYCREHADTVGGGSRARSRRYRRGASYEAACERRKERLDAGLPERGACVYCGARLNRNNESGMCAYCQREIWFEGIAEGRRAAKAAVRAADAAESERRRRLHESMTADEWREHTAAMMGDFDGGERLNQFGGARLVLPCGCVATRTGPRIGRSASRG